jgi:hypothetical protein
MSCPVMTPHRGEDVNLDLLLLGFAMIVSLLDPWFGRLL